RVYFFFQAEDGIRDFHVTGVQTCALPIYFADELERIVGLHGPSTVAAVIVEPMAGSTGVLPPPKGYLERLRDITSKYGILLIFEIGRASCRGRGGVGVGCRGSLDVCVGEV